MPPYAWACSVRFDTVTTDTHPRCPRTDRTCAVVAGQAYSWSLAQCGGDVLRLKQGRHFLGRRLKADCLGICQLDVLHHDVRDARPTAMLIICWDQCLRASVTKLWFHAHTVARATADTSAPRRNAGPTCCQLLLFASLAGSRALSQFRFPGTIEPIDAVLICTSFSQHREVARRAGENSVRCISVVKQSRVKADAGVNGDTSTVRGRRSLLHSDRASRTPKRLASP